jgi:micrococcal nuclease
MDEVQVDRHDAGAVTGSCVVAALLVVSAFPSCAAGREDTAAVQPVELARVERVGDGDTIEVTLSSGKRERVRLLGIDAPELHHPARPEEYYAAEARAYLEQRIADGEVRLRRDSLREQDRAGYDRLLRYVELPDGQSLNAELVRTGHAYAYTRFPLTELDRFRALEEEARREQRGVWNDGGLTEIAWNRAQGILPYTVHPMTNRSWAIEYGSCIRTHIRSNKLIGELNRLLGLITEYRGGQLEERLLEAGYVRFRVGDR